jgi:hypothetical protein
MHPLLARYMDLDAARQTLSRRAEGAELTAEERAWLGAADALPDAREVVAGAAEDDAEEQDVQEPLLLLAAHAAAAALGAEPRLQPALARAREALVAEGATPDQVSEFVASLVMEEAFGYEDEADDFDADFVADSLGEVPQLARLTAESVEEIERGFRGGRADPVRGAVVQSLVRQAWGEGPAFINPEHVEAALDEARGVLSKKEREQVPAVLGELLAALHGKGLVSARRLERLQARLADAAGAPPAKA